jgi:hypothetical protein
MKKIGPKKEERGSWDHVKGRDYLHERCGDSIIVEIDQHRRIK